MQKPLFKKVDCVMVRVDDLEKALEFYQGKLDHELRWKSDKAAGLKLGDCELVLSTVNGPETDLLVDSVDEAVKRFVDAGGTKTFGPEDITVGKVAGVKDPFGNELIILDLSKGRFTTDESANVTGVS